MRITLTKSGAFYRKFVVWSAEEFQWPDWTPRDLYVVNRVLNEQDFVPLAVMHDLLRAARLIRHFKGRAVLTKSGTAIISNHGALQALLFDTYFTTDFSSFERFPVSYGEDDLLHYLGAVQNRLNEWVRFGDFAGWCLPMPLITQWQISPEADACFYLMSRVPTPTFVVGPGGGGPRAASPRNREPEATQNGAL